MIIGKRGKNRNAYDKKVNVRWGGYSIDSRSF